MAAKKKVTRKVDPRVCNLKEGKYCEAMDGVLQDWGGGRKGLVLMELRSRDTFEMTSRMILYKAKSSPREKPILLNVCPWCRRKLGKVKL